MTSSFLIKNSSELMRISKGNLFSKNLPRFSIEHEGEIYRLIFQTMDSEYYINIGMLQEFFQSGFPTCVILRPKETSCKNEIKCFICFHHIPQIPSLMNYVSEIDFSLYVFEKELIDIRFAMKSDIDSPSFALGCFNVISFIEQFKRVSSTEFRIPVLWKMFVRSLCEIGYFDFFDYCHFTSIVFKFFRRMFHLNEKILLIGNFVLKELFFSFIQRLLMKNSWFLIFGEFIHQIPRSRSLIRLFSDSKNLPVVNFIDYALGLVGLSYLSGVGEDFNMSFLVVSIETTEVIHVGSQNTKWYPDIDDDEDDDFSSPLQRTPAPSKPKSIQQGILPFGHDQYLIVFITGFSIHVFIRRPNGTFEHFNIWLFVLLHALETDDRLHEATTQFTHFPYIGLTNLREGLEQCGFLEILEGTATVEEIHKFFYQSDLGIVLETLYQNLPEFQQRLHAHYSMKYQEETTNNHQQFMIEYRCDSIISSIKSNRFIKEFMSFLTPVLQQLQERHDLTREITEILQFLEELFAFFTPDPLSLDM